jgi:hypothetical protein
MVCNCLYGISQNIITIEIVEKLEILLQDQILSFTEKGITIIKY